MSVASGSIRGTHFLCSFILTLLAVRFSFPHLLWFYFFFNFYPLNIKEWIGLGNRKIFNGPFFLSRTSRSSPDTILLPEYEVRIVHCRSPYCTPNKCVFFFDCSLLF